MPPKVISTQQSSEGGGRGRGGRGRGRGQGDGGRGGGGRGRGGPAVAPAVAPVQQSTTGGKTLPAADVAAVGVKRTGFGTVGTKMMVRTNHYHVNLNPAVHHQYDVEITPKIPKKLGALHGELFRLVKGQNPAIFEDVVYDGRKIAFSNRKLFQTNFQEFQATGSDKKQYRIRFTKTENPLPTEVLQRYVNGKASPTSNEGVLPAIVCLNAALAMAAKENPAIVGGARSFYDRNFGYKDLGMGLEVWRGIFQSVRPGIGKMLVNVDITSALFYKSGPLIRLALEHLGSNDIKSLTKRGLGQAERHRLNDFLRGLPIITKHSGKVYEIDQVSEESANTATFKLREGPSTNIAKYWKATYNRELEHPDLVCIQIDIKTGPPIILPLEVCEVRAGEMRRALPPPQLTKGVVEFSTKRPADRMATIQNGVMGMFGYPNNKYASAFGANIVPEFLEIPSRVLPPPTLQYATPNGAPTTLTPRQGEGTWRMGNMKFWQRAAVSGWAIANFDRFDPGTVGRVNDCVRGLRDACQKAGITGLQSEPELALELNPQGFVTIQNQLLQLGRRWMTRNNTSKPPSLFVVILPQGADAAYHAVKNFANFKQGIAIQCLLGSKLRNVKPAYFENVALKINCKLGGVNVVPAIQNIPFLNDPSNPVVVFGADVVHPPPKQSKGGPRSDAAKRPSFTCVVGSLDSHVSRYTHVVNAQKSGQRQEVIQDMREMAAQLLKESIEFKMQRENKSRAAAAPKRLLMFRDGVGEGQFPQIIEEEVQSIRDACHDLGLDVKITFLVVGKRHHARFEPTSQQGSDRSGNCPAGTVVDTDITDPIEQDFYLQSHAGLLGTSRPGHYNTLVDDNNLTVDEIQQLSNAMTYIYQRSTRSVSIPAPTYYADSILTQVENQYSAPTPNDPFDFRDAYSVAKNCDFDANKVLQEYKKRLAKPHKNMKTTMYFQ